MADFSAETAAGRNPKNGVTMTEVRRVDILRPLYEKLINSGGKGITRALVYGFGFGYGNYGWCDNPVAITIISYSDNEALKNATRSIPYGLNLIGLVEFEEDEEQDVYAALDHLDHPVLLKVDQDNIICSTGLDFLKVVETNVISEISFWKERACTFRLKGSLLLTTMLESEDLNDCFALAKARVNNKAAYVVGTTSSVTILPPDGHLLSEISALKSNTKVVDLTKAVKSANPEDVKEKAMTYFSPGINIITTQILFDHTKPSSVKLNHSAVVVADKSACCKYFEHYMNLDVLVVVPNNMRVADLYRNFNEAVCNQIESGIQNNITEQLVNSISAEKPEVFHFWPGFAEHFISVVYPQNTSEEKQKDIRHELHRLFFIRETRPYFRRSASLFQSFIGLVSPHTSLTGKFEETESVKGHYEYRHYMQEEFNDDGWGCAYRSLQTIVSWFRLQGFTCSKVPTHREIQECLVSLGDKPASFVGSKQWIGSTEVAFVLEALLGISCRILSLSSGGEMASRVSELQSHFKLHGTPVMIGGGVLAHTIIGTSRDADSDSNVNYLVLDPHYTGKDDLKTILNKGWVGWKDNSFWSKKDFYNMCMPLLPAAI